MMQEIVGKGRFDYLAFFPDNYNPSKSYPLVLFLHGAGERSGNLELLKKAIIPQICLERTSFPAVVVCPLCKENFVWTSQTESLFSFLEQILEEYPIDRDAVSVTGLSMGGYGTWQLIMDRPDLFSAAAPVCGGALAALLDRAKDLPIRIFHGEKDDIVDCFYSKDAFKKLKQFGAKDVTLTLYPECYHDSWTKTYRETDVLDWLIEKRRIDEEKGEK